MGKSRTDTQNQTPEDILDRLGKAAAYTLSDLLQNGSETIRLRASVWLLEMMQNKKLPTDHRNLLGELRIGFPDEED